MSELDRKQKEAALADLLAEEAANTAKQFEKGVEMAEAALEEALRDVIECEDDLRLKEAVAKSAYRILKPRESVSFHHRNAIDVSYLAADKGWETDLELREKLVEKESDLRFKVG